MGGLGPGIALVLALAPAGGGSGGQGAPAEGERAAREAVLASARHPWLKWPDLSDCVGELRALYSAEADGLVWFENAAPLGATDAGLEALASADERGLSPEDYDAPLLLVRAGDALSAEVENARVLFDLALSVGLLRHLNDVHRGRVDPHIAGFGYDAHGADLDLSGRLRAARDAGSLAGEITRLEPQIAPYRRLKAALGPWRLLAEGPPLELAPEVKKLAPGSPYVGTAALAARLRAFGDLPASAPDPGPVYEGSLVEAVERLQDRLGLVRDGTLGRETFHAVNRSPRQCLRQMELTLERFRWLPDLHEREVVVVNIPAFLLWALATDESPDLAMRVVVGKALRHDTPAFLGELRYVSFAPYWNVPPSIAREEIVPTIRREPGYLDREGFEIVALGSGDGPAPTLPPTPENLDLVARGSLRVRQAPGPRNALGRVKFSFPNQDNIYMHDTPARELFSRSRRDFSHGCIRLEDPAALARWLLRDVPEWPVSRIAEAMDGNRTVWASLGRPVPVVLFYATAFVDSAGRIRFFDDIYGLDARLEKALARGYPYPRLGLGHGAGEGAPVGRLVPPRGQ